MRCLSLYKLFVFVIVLFGIEKHFAQKNDIIRVAFWNFENFFDPFVDTTRHYNEFTEDGSQHWTLSRFYKKRNNMYKAILSLSEGKPLAILGICEVENTFVTSMLFNETPLKKHNYRVVHYEGEDRRGIDVALVYSIDKLQLIKSDVIHIRDPDNKKYRTRDILYAKFYDRGEDTLHCFVNHWPSRYGGERETIYLRNIAAETLKRKIDSLVKMNDKIPKIIVMGDFNDSPYDESIIKYLGAVPYKDKIRSDTLINLFADDKTLGFKGTLKHQYQWQTFDQIIVSASLLDNLGTIRYVDESASIFHDDYLFVKDETYGGVKLFRTYIGPKYQGGYSDHLPIYIDLEIKK